MSPKAEKVLKNIYHYYTGSEVSPEEYVKQTDPKESTSVGFGSTLYEVAQALVELKSISTEREELREALDRLSGEVAGCWEMAERALRESIGNTNYHIVEERLEASRVALGIATKAKEASK